MDTEDMNNAALERQNRKARLSPELVEVLKMLKSLEGQSTTGSTVKDA